MNAKSEQERLLEEREKGKKTVLSLLHSSSHINMQDLQHILLVLIQQTQNQQQLNQL